MKRVAISYKNAIQWLVNNDDTEFLRDDEPQLSVSASLVADIYGRGDSEVIADLRKATGGAP